MDLMQLIQRCIDARASDLILRAGSRPWWRCPGVKFGPVPDTVPVYSQEISFFAELISGQITAGVVARSGHDQDFRAVVKGTAWRCNLSACCPRSITSGDIDPKFQAAEARDLCLTLRRISSRRPAPAELGITESELQWWFPEDGLVLVAGIPGSGKSTVQASVLAERARRMTDYILTYESPVEQDLQNEVYACGRIVQQDLPWDLCDPDAEQGAADKHYAYSMRNAVRRACTVVFLGEVRTGEVGGALLLGMSAGFAVYTTIHAASAALAPARLMGLLPETERLAGEAALREGLRLVVHCSRTAEGGFARTMVPIEAGDARLKGSWRGWAEQLAPAEGRALREIPLIREANNE